MKVFKRKISAFTALTLILSLSLGGVTSVGTACAAPASEAEAEEETYEGFDIVSLLNSSAAPARRLPAARQKTLMMPPSTTRSAS